MWYQQMGMGLSGMSSWSSFSLAPLIGVLALWSIIWKGLALWRAARMGQKGWFVALLVINTAGILEIIYLYVITKNPDKSNPTTPVSP